MGLIDAWQEKNEFKLCIENCKKAGIKEESINQAWSNIQNKDYIHSKGTCRKILTWEIAELIFESFIQVKKDSINHFFDQKTDQKMTEKQQSFIHKLVEQKIGGNKLLKKTLGEIGVENVADIPKNNPIIKNLIALKNDPEKEPKVTPKQLATLTGNMVKGSQKNPDPCGVKAKFGELLAEQLTEKVIEEILGEKKPVKNLTLSEASKIIGCLMTNLKRKRRKKDWRFDSSICK